ncbi:MAG: helicase associated domain-containing protein, partial [Ginsengibacter sp.]
PPKWTDYEEQKMNSINFKWQMPNIGGGSSPDDEHWLENYFKLEDFKRKFGHPNPSQTDKDPAIKKLAKWVNDQRTLKNTGKKNKKGTIRKLIKVREELLTELGVDWEWQLTQRKIELEEFIKGYLALRSVYPDEKPKKGDRTYSKILQKKAEIRHRYKNDTSPEGKWRIDRLNEIGFRWT